MTADELRAIMSYLRDKVQLEYDENEQSIQIIFEEPEEDTMSASGLNAEGVTSILGAPWWEEMITDIIETPEFCDPDDTPEQILEYAKDVVSDYLRKRVSLG